MKQCSHCGGAGVAGSSLPCPECNGSGMHTRAEDSRPSTPATRNTDTPNSPGQPGAPARPNTTNSGTTDAGTTDAGTGAAFAGAGSRASTSDTAGEQPTAEGATPDSANTTPANPTDSYGTPTTGGSYAPEPSTASAAPATVPATGDTDTDTDTDTDAATHRDAERVSEAGKSAQILGMIDPTGVVAGAGMVADGIAEASKSSNPGGQASPAGRNPAGRAPGTAAPHGGGAAGRRDGMRNQHGAAPQHRASGRRRHGDDADTRGLPRKTAAKLEGTARRAAQRTKAAIANTGKASLAVLLVALLLIGGGGFLISTTFSPRNDATAAPKPNDTQCVASGGAAWCEVFWGASVASSSDGGEPVSYALLSAIAHYTTDNGRRSPQDSVDRTPTAGVGSDTLAGGNHAAVSVLGTSAATSMASAIDRHRASLDITRAPSADGATTAAMVAKLWPDGTPSFIVRPNLLVFAGDADTDPAAVTAAANNLLTKAPGSVIFWANIPGKTDVNTALAAAAAANPRLKIVDIAGAATTDARLADPKSADGLTESGRVRAAQLVADAVVKDAGQTNLTSSPGANGYAAAVKDATVAAPFGAGAGLDGCPTATGTTYTAKPGTPVFSVVGGRVSNISTEGSHGLSVTVTAANHYIRYSHLSSVAVTKGQTVAGGAMVGTAGNTGRPNSEGVLVEWMRTTGAPTQTDCGAYEDIAAFTNTPTPGATPSTSTSATPTPSGSSTTTPTAGATPTPSGAATPSGSATTSASASATPSGSSSGTAPGTTSLPDKPDWIADTGVLNKPGHETECPVPTIEPGIAGPAGASGPFLLNGDESAKMRADGQDPNNPCQSAVWLARAIAKSDKVHQAASANHERFVGKTQYTKFLVDTVATSGLVVNPKADGTSCTAFPADSTVAEKIAYSIACRSQNKDPHTVTGYAGTTPQTVDGTESVKLLQAEAIQVAGVFSKYGAEPCDAQATYAGVFPLTTAQMDATDVNGHKGDRCNPDDNIAAAAEILLKGESVKVSERGTAQGPYTALLGGWASFTWVTTRGTAAALASGPNPWRPDATCTQTIDNWAADPASTVDNAPLNSGGCNAPGRTDFYDAARPALAKAATTVGNNASTILAAIPAAGPATGDQAVLTRFSRGAAVATPAASAQSAVRNGMSAPGGMSELAEKVANFAVAAAGYPDHGVWIPATCGAVAEAVSGLAGSGGPAINLPSGDAETNAHSIFLGLKGAGATDAGAAGALGNIQQESTFNPAILEGGGPIIPGVREGVGIIQWSYTRREALWAAATAKGVPWQDLNFQIQYMIDEIKASYPQTWTILTTATDPYEAAIGFHKDYEGSADSDAAIRSGRGEPAKQWYDKFKGQGGNNATTAVPASLPSPTASASASTTAGTGGAGSTGRVMPVAAGTQITSGFGNRDIGSGIDFHDGVDYGVPIGTPVYAAHDGTLRNRTDDPTGYGKYVQITSDDGKTITDYGHVSEMGFVADGAHVTAGTLIAKSGNEGSSQGPHLHFRVHVDNNPVNPVEWLAGASSAGAGSAPAASTAGGTCVRSGTASSAYDASALATTCPTTAPAGTVIVPGNIADLCRQALANAASPQAAKALLWGFAHLGDPYSQSNRMADHVFDCSSFVGRSWASGGGVTEFFSQGPATPAYASPPSFVTEITKEQAKAGDIIIMWGAGDTLANSGGNYGHAQLYLGNDLVLQSGGSPNNVNVASYTSETQLNGWQHKFFHVTPPAATVAA